MTKWVLWFLCFAAVSAASSGTSLADAGGGADPYYGHAFLDAYRGGKLRGPALRAKLHELLKYVHVKGADGFDEIKGQCTGKCYQHVMVGYDDAREILFGELYLTKKNGSYAIPDLYCERLLGSEDFDGGVLGPGKIPDHRILNVEHTWPQSQFSRRYVNEMQKSDLHHLFPTDSEMNSRRSSYAFGEVDEEDGRPLKCTNSKLGESKGGDTVFQPPLSHQGNVARAMFYFAVRYEMDIPAEEEATLRKWHKADPADAAEKARNDLIFGHQGNRNPFVDFPDLADQIGDF
jgi:deoxyribonuclease I